MSFGDTVFGATPFGDALTTLAPQLALADTLRTAIVGFQGPFAPLAFSPITPGDALNPATWVIRNTRTTAQKTVFGARMFRPVWGVLNTWYVQILLSEPWEAYDTFSIEFGTLLDEAYLPVAGPVTYLFLGCAYVATVGLPGVTEQMLVDVYNQQKDDTLSGSLVVGSQGDYLNQTGEQLIKKLIYRRLTTPLGAFRHLPDYGVGLFEKMPYSPADLSQLKLKIEAQVAQEREISAVSASISLSDEGLMLIKMQVRLRSQDQTFSLEFPFTGARG